MKRYILIFLALSILVWTPKIAAQYGPNTIQLGENITGSLMMGDQQLTSGEFADHYLITVSAGQSLQITLNSNDFDTYLMLRGGTVSINNDDMATGNLNSAINTVIAAPGNYTISVTSYQAGETGSYQLFVGGSIVSPQPFGQAPPGQTGTVPTFTGELMLGDQVLDSGEYTDYFTFTGTAGQRLSLIMTSNDFDTYLGVFGPNNFQEGNDDAPGLGLNSRLDLTLPVNGEYQVQATSYEAGMVGSYAIVMNETVTAIPQPSIQTNNGSQTGTLAYGDATLSSGEFYDEIPLSGEAGEQITINLTSNDFDTYLMFRGNGLNLDNDDIDGTLNSQISTTLPISGQYRIVVTSYSPGEQGAYNLQISHNGQSAPNGQNAIGGVLTPNMPIQDSLVNSDPTRREGQHFRTYTFNGTAGQRAVLDMNSSFDTYLILNGPNNFEDHNDDIQYPENTNSRIDLILPATGSYQVSASSYSANIVGPYALSLAFSGDRTIPTGISPVPSSVSNTGPTGSTILGPIQGNLAFGDETLSSGEFLDSYTFQGTAGQGVTINLTSTDFDSYLIFNGPDPNYQEDNDDFPGQGLNSRLELGLPTAGTYTVGVTSYAPGETGNYTVTVTDGTSIQQAGRGQIYAVLAGITNYADGEILPFCADDAIKLQEDLARTGLLANESTLLTNSQVTRANLEAAFQRIAAVISPEDEFIFFYSGHGFQLSTGDPSELDGQDESIYVYDGNITDDVVAGWFDTIDARLATIALDSCFSGGFARDVISSSNRMGIFSSEEDVLSTTAERFQAGGYLSHFLRTGLAGAADQEPMDQVITVGELTQYLRRQWATNVIDNSVESGDGTRTYQNLVIERGGVSLSDVMVYPVR